MVKPDRISDDLVARCGHTEAHRVFCGVLCNRALDYGKNSVAEAESEYMSQLNHQLLHLRSLLNNVLVAQLAYRISFIPGLRQTPDFVLWQLGI